MEIDKLIIGILRRVYQELSGPARNSVMYRFAHNSDARRALSEAIASAGPEVLHELAMEGALERLRDIIAEEQAPVSLVDSNPRHPCHRTSKRRQSRRAARAEER